MKNELINHSLAVPEGDTPYIDRLLQSAAAAGLWTAKAAETLGMQSFHLLRQRVTAFTKGMSSSLPLEQAEALMNSTAFTTGLWLQSQGGDIAALRELKTEPLQDLYQKGRHLLLERIKHARFLLMDVQRTALPIAHIAYHTTIGSGLPDFFAAYDPEFAAHEIPGSIDYPTALPLPPLAGINYITVFLQWLQRENQFCRRYPPADIAALLRGIDEEYEESLLNIFSPVFLNALGTTMVQKGGLFLSPAERELLAKRLSPLSEQGLRQESARAAKTLARGDDAMESYFFKVLPEAQQLIATALANDSPASCFIPPRTKRSYTLFRDGKAKSDEGFRSLCREIASCQKPEDKARIITEEIRSFTDLWDILTSGYLLTADFHTLFGKLDEFTLALLWQKLPQTEEADLHCSADEIACLQELKWFFQSLEEDRCRQIRQWAKDIRIDESK